MFSIVALQPIYFSTKYCLIALVSHIAAFYENNAFQRKDQINKIWLVAPQTVN